MRIVFRDPALELVRTDQWASTGVSVALAKACRKKLDALEAAPDERTIRGWKSLHYEKLAGDRDGQHSIRVNDQWRLVFILDKSTNPPTIEILSLEDYH